MAVLGGKRPLRKSLNSDGCFFGIILGVVVYKEADDSFNFCFKGVISS
jgi:hypothetical protein